MQMFIPFTPHFKKFLKLWILLDESIEGASNAPIDITASHTSFRGEWLQSAIHSVQKKFHFFGGFGHERM